MNTADNPLFEGIREQDREALLNCLNAYTRTYSKGDLIPLDAADRRNAGIVLSGALHMVKEDVWGHQSLVAYLGVGSLFGESAMLVRDPHSHVSYIAASEVKALFIPFDRILHPCKNQCGFHNTLASNMFRLMGEKMALLLDKIEASSKGSLREKILSYLSLLSEQQGSKYIRVPLNRTEMASFLQSNRSAMTRELSDMQAEGLIDFDGNTFVLKS